MKSYLTTIFIGVLLGTNLLAESNKNGPTRVFEMQIKIECPDSELFDNLTKTIPPPGYKSPTFDDWKKTLDKTTNALNKLLKSGKVNESTWSAHVAKK